MGYLWVTLHKNTSIMTELTTAQSFVVRVYRMDKDDPTHLAGQVESLDGSGSRTPFTSLDELATILNHPGRKRRRRPATTESP